MNSSRTVAARDAGPGNVAQRSSAGRPSLKRKPFVPQAAAKEVTLLDYGAGNVRSVRNAIKKLGFTIKDVSGRATGA